MTIVYWLILFWLYLYDWAYNPSILLHSGLNSALQFWLSARFSSPVKVVLVSLLVDQLSGLFLTFFGRPKKICSVSGNFWSVSEFFLVKLWFFGILKRNFGIPKRNLVDQKNQRLTKNSLRLNKFFFGRPKKGRNRLDNWSTKRLTKTTWTGLVFTSCFFCHWIGQKSSNLNSRLATLRYPKFKYMTL